MTFGAAIRACLRKYVTFSGRASRSEYWQFVLFVVLVQIGAGIVDSALADPAGQEPVAAIGDYTEGSQAGGPLAAIVSLGAFLPSLSAGWRRMHDSGRSGLYLVYPLIVIVGIGGFADMTGAFANGIDNLNTDTLPGIVVVLAFVVLALSPFLVLWWLSRPSQPGPNQYGPNPSEVTP